MQGLEEGFMGFQNIRVTFCPLNWYQFAKILILAHGLIMGETEIMCASNFGFLYKVHDRHFLFSI